MKKEPQIFTTIDAQDVPVSDTVLGALEQEEIRETLLRKCINEVLKEMAYIDDFKPGDGPVADPEVAKHYFGRSERLKKKRAKPSGTWMRVINVLLAGGHISERDPRTSKSYMVFDAQDNMFGKIRQKTFEELSDSGFLDWNERYDIYVLSDEGKGYLK